MGVLRCPITYESTFSEEKYSHAGLTHLSRSLTELSDFPYSADDQIKEAARRATKMSIQGVQPKLSVILNVRKKMFEVVDEGGEYIIKPPLPTYREVPENEDLSMRLAAMVGIDVPVHGLIYAKDQSLVYVIKRFDRKSKKQKVPTEDFAQLMEMNRETKYNASMEKVAETCERYCTFPLMDKERLLVRTVFSFLIGNEDMHIKNFSVITQDGVVSLSPAYDLLSTTLAMGGAQEELALPLNGKKNNLKRSDFLDYFARERLGLQDKVVDAIVERFAKVLSEWTAMIDNSFLSGKMQKNYHMLVNDRRARLEL